MGSIKPSYASPFVLPCGALSDRKDEADASAATDFRTTDESDS